jgi:DNA repair exonuclease SbcCD ATPase subunit
LKNTLDEIEKGLKEVENLIKKNKKKKVSFAVPLRPPRLGNFYDWDKKIDWEEADKMAKINKWLADAKSDEKKLEAEIKDCTCLNEKMQSLKESLAKAIIERKRLVELRNHVAFLAGRRRSYIPERISYIPYYGKLTF